MSAVSVSTYQTKPTHKNISWCQLFCFCLPNQTYYTFLTPNINTQENDLLEFLFTYIHRKSIIILRGAGWKSISCMSKTKSFCNHLFTAHAIILWLCPILVIMILMHDQTSFGIQIYITLVTGIFDPIMFGQNMNF